MLAPMSDLVDGEIFRSALRRWASGVTILTSRVGDEIHGMTVSAFSSVSADPPLVLACANQDSTTHAMIRAGGVFAVNVLSSAQADVSTHFATAPADMRFEGIDFSHGETGVPLIGGALAQLECRVRSAHAEGTHTIYIGEVLFVHVSNGAPLLYFDGGYADLEKR